MPSTHDAKLLSLPSMLSQVGFASQQSEAVHVSVAQVFVRVSFKWFVPSTHDAKLLSLPSMLSQVGFMVQTFELSHAPPAHAAVQVVIPVLPTVFFVVDDEAHPPVAKRVVDADVQVYVTLLAAAPGMTVHPAHRSAVPEVSFQKALLSHSPVKRDVVALVHATALGARPFSTG